VTDQRLNPSAAPEPAHDVETKSRRGRLKIFFGMCPGVGKTYAMLEEARRRHAEGIEVVIGVVETHGRAETAALLEGLPIVPRTKVEYRETSLDEMDLDAVLLWRPQLLVVDELAHTNAPGSRHPKRYQDVLELLDAGLDVLTTLNVQHVESRAEAVAQITGIQVRETVPDSVLDMADEIALIDLPAEQLRERLAAGKVYLGDKAAMAAEHFFKESNLSALREMSLRLTAEHVDRSLCVMLRSKRDGEPWKNAARFMVAVGPSPHAEALIRWTRRAATAIEAPWFAASVELPQALGEASQSRLAHNLALARRLGAEVVTAPGAAVGPTLLELARRHQATQLVLGKPVTSAWHGLISPSPVDWLIRHSGDVDIHLIRAGEQEPAPPSFPRPGGTAREYLAVLGIAAGVTLSGLALTAVTGHWTIALVYLLAVLLAALRLSRWPTLALAALSALCWNFLFIPPRFTFAIHEIHDIVMFGMFFVVATAIGELTTRLRERETAERRREQRVFVLYRITRALAQAGDAEGALSAAAHEMRAAFGAECAFFVRDAKGEFIGAAHPAGTLAVDAKEESVAAWAFQKRQAAGHHTDTLPDAAALHIPMLTGERAEGVLALRIASPPTPDQRDLLDACAAQLAVFLERERALAAAQRTRVLEESERLQRALFDSVSHELKTPLAAISVALDQPHPDTLEIRRANDRLRRTVDLLLDATRLDSGLVKPRAEWCDASEVLLDARTRAGLAREDIGFDVPAGVPHFHTDPGLLAQVLAILFSNAITHGGSHETPICRTLRDGDDIRFDINDRGPGIPSGSEEGIFGRFQRGGDTEPGGLGLGLSIARRLAAALGGTLNAENRPAGGARFTLKIPVGGEMKLPA
jgi:two-component system, OmpR family, sensor histidine kinase KdpD